LLPPTTDGLELGGVKAGNNVTIAVDGTISASGVLQTNNPYAYNSYIFPVAAVPSAAPGTNGQLLTLIDRVTGEVGWTNSGTLTTVVGTGGVTVVSTPTTATVSLATVPTIVPATYGATGLIPTFTVNAQGQITNSGIANPYPPFQIATVTVPLNLVLDFDSNNTNWEWTLQTNTTIQAPVNTQSGQTGCLLLRQNSVSPFVVTWASNWKFANFTPYAGNPIAAAVDLIQFTVVASNYLVVTNIVSNVG
jgi:hypothetical protein